MFLNEKQLRSRSAGFCGSTLFSIEFISGFILFLKSLYMYMAVILLPFMGYSPPLLNLGILLIKSSNWGKNSPKLGKYRPFLDWEAACIWL